MPPPERSYPPATSYESSSSLCKVGWLYKKCGSTFKPWQKRYVVLDRRSRMVHYYHTSTDQKPKCSLYLDNFTVHRPTLIEIKFRKSIPCFVLFPQRETERGFTFSATDEKIVEEWISNLSSMTPSKMGSGRAGSPNKAHASLSSATASMNRLSPQASNPYLNGGPNLGNNSPNFAQNNNALKSPAGNSNLGASSLGHLALGINNNMSPGHNALQPSPGRNGTNSPLNDGSMSRNSKQPVPLNLGVINSAIGGMNSANSTLASSGAISAGPITGESSASAQYGALQTIVPGKLGVDGGQTIVGGLMQGNNSAANRTIFNSPNAQFGQQTIVGGAMYGQTIVGNASLAAGGATIIGGLRHPNGTSGGGSDETVVRSGLGTASNRNSLIGKSGPVTVQQTLTYNLIRMVPDNPNIPVFERKVTHNVIRIGRAPAPENIPPESFIAFPTKVVSRMHAELWTSNGEFYVRDTKSQSGTFLNAMRLGESGKESKPFKIRTGDIIQFGVDFKGNVETGTKIPDDSKCVSVKVECKQMQEIQRFVRESDAADMMIPENTAEVDVEQRESAPNMEQNDPINRLPILTN